MVQGFVRLIIHGGVGIGGRAHDHAGREGRDGDFRILVFLLAEPVQDGPDAGLRIFPGDVFQIQKELIPAEPAAEAVLTAGQDRFAHQAERTVPGFMAAGIVDPLQVIHIEEYKAARVFLHATGDCRLSGGPAHQARDNIHLAR